MAAMAASLSFQTCRAVPSLRRSAAGCAGGVKGLGSSAARVAKEPGHWVGEAPVVLTVLSCLFVLPSGWSPPPNAKENQHGSKSAPVWWAAEAIIPRTK